MEGGISQNMASIFGHFVVKGKGGHDQKKKKRKKKEGMIKYFCLDHLLI
jgi:hypothetical protein